MASNFKKAFSMGPWGIPWCHLCGKWADGGHLGVKKHKEYMADFNRMQWPDADLKPLPDEDDDGIQVAAPPAAPPASAPSSASASASASASNIMAELHELKEMFDDQQKRLKIVEGMVEVLRFNMQTICEWKGQNQSQSSSAPRSAPY